MKWGEFVEQADEIRLAKQFDAYMGLEHEAPKRLTADDRARQYGDLENDEERELAEQFDRLVGVEHERRLPLGARDYSGLHGAEEIILAMEYDEQFGWAGAR